MFGHAARLALVIAFSVFAAPFAAHAQDGTSVDVWKSPYCGCCSGWVQHMRAAGFHVRVHETDDLEPIKNSSRIPDGLKSCHTATVGDYVVEGHVPPADVVRMLREKPPIAGLSVPGMPLGSPGMETANGDKDAYDVIAFDKDGGTSVFSQHNKPESQ